MKTKDNISKKKQKLWQEMAFWNIRERDSRAIFTFTPEDEIKKKASIVFCRQEIKKRQKELDNLQIRSRRQILAGWK